MQRIIARGFVFCSPIRSIVERSAGLSWKRAGLEEYTHLDGAPRPFKAASFTDAEGHLWLEQNPAKASKWAKLARQGHQLAWEFAGPGGAYTGRMLIDGKIYIPSQATKKFLS